MVMPVFVVSMVLAISVSLTALWNASMIGVRKGGRRAAHVAVLTLIIALLAGLGLDAPMEQVRLCAVALMIGVGANYFLERKPRPLLCLVQFAFGALIASGLPFVAA